MSELHLVFEDFPGPGNECVFVEAEDKYGRSVNCGEWRKREDGHVELVVTCTNDGTNMASAEPVGV